LARNGAGAWGDSAELARAASGGAERHQPEADAGIQQLVAWEGEETGWGRGWGHWGDGKWWRGDMSVGLSWSEADGAQPVQQQWAEQSRTYMQPRKKTKQIYIYIYIFIIYILYILYIIYIYI